jgi:hypothetical protein
MRYLTVEKVLEINAEVMGGRHALRDLGLLESAVARPQASAFGADVYPDLASKAATSTASLARFEPRIHRWQQAHGGSFHSGFPRSQWIRDSLGSARGIGFRAKPGNPSG